jgi:hypothetical protein
LGEKRVGENLEPIGTSYQKVYLKYDFISKSQKPSIGDCINFETNQIQNQNSMFTDINNQFLETITCKKDKFQKMLEKFKTREKKDLMKLIRILLDCAVCQRRSVKIVLWSEIDYLMFEFFAELLIKIIVYHKNENLLVESCRFRNGKCYLIKVKAKESFISNRSITIKNMNSLF